MPATLLKLISAGLLCVLLSWHPLAAAKDMHWSSLTVHLQVDEQGLLHITERHAMVFDGDWNGGERTFQWRRWQDFALVSVTEILPETGTRIALTEGDLNGVEQYRLADKALRWRNRLSTDPPFANAEKLTRSNTRSPAPCSPRPTTTFISWTTTWRFRIVPARSSTSRPPSISLEFGR